MFFVPGITCLTPCLNGGECVNGECQCAEGYVGLQCEYPGMRLGSFLENLGSVKKP